MGGGKAIFETTFVLGLGLEQRKELFRGSKSLKMSTQTIKNFQFKISKMLKNYRKLKSSQNDPKKVKDYPVGHCRLKPGGRGGGAYQKNYPGWQTRGNVDSVARISNLKYQNCRKITENLSHLKMTQKLCRITQ